MRKSLLVASLLVSVFVSSASADLKAGQYAGVRPCRGSSGGTEVVATSKKTIGVATCKSELQKLLIAQGVCTGKKKNEKVEYSFQFGDDKDPQKATGTHYVYCR